MRPAKKFRGEVINTLTTEQLGSIVAYLRENKFKQKSSGEHVYYVEKCDRGWYCNLECTRTLNGEAKYPQVDLNRFHIAGTSGKHLVHLLWWRWENDGAPIDPTLHISHLDKEPGYLRLVQESRDMNESRKYCHLFGWYKKLPGEDTPRCPHRENPCSGP